jgi:hypothetical protein
VPDYVSEQNFRVSDFAITIRNSGFRYQLNGSQKNSIIKHLNTAGSGTPQKSGMDGRACLTDDDFEIFMALYTVARSSLRSRSSLLSQVLLPASGLTRFSARSATFSARSAALRCSNTKN